MPKWKFDHRTGMMVPEKKTGVEITKRMGGLMIEDHDRNFHFMIMYGTHEIQYVFNVDIKRNGTHLFSERDARKIADVVKRVSGVSESKYTDWRYFALGYEDPDEYEEALESFIKSLGRSDYNEVINENINEVFLQPNSGADEQVVDLSGDKVPRKFGRFIAASGIKLLKCLLIPGYWAYLAISSVGALHLNFQKKWAKSLFNDAAYQKILKGEGGMSKDDIKKKLAKDVLSENKVYWAALSNGEVVRVVAINEEEAKDMAKELINKDFIKNYDRYSQLRQGNSTLNTYRVYMKGGEVAYAVSEDKYSAMRDAQTTREVLYSGFKTDKRYSLDFTRKKGEKLRTNSQSVSELERPEAYKVDNLGTIEINRALADDDHIEIYANEPRLVYETSGNKYTIDDIDWLKISMVCNNDKELESILRNFTENRDMRDLIEKNEANREKFANGSDDVYGWEITMQNDDEFVLFIDKNDIPDAITQKRGKDKASPATGGAGISDEANTKEEASGLCTKMEISLANAHKNFYATFPKNKKCRQTSTRTIDTIEKIEDRNKYNTPFTLPNYAEANVSSVESGQSIGDKVRIQMYA